MHVSFEEMNEYLLNGSAAAAPVGDKNIVNLKNMRRCVMRACPGSGHGHGVDVILTIAYEKAA
jgi:hypothetical protein